MLDSERSTSNKSEQFKKPDNDESQEYSVNDLLNIWRDRPAKRDIKSWPNAVKVLFIGFIWGALFSISYFSSGLLITSFLFSSIMVISFIIVSFGNIFFFYEKVRFRGGKRIDLFEDLNFRIRDKNSDTLFIFNRKGYGTTGLKIFKIDIIPETVHGNVKRFLRSLDRLGVPYTYQIIQTSNIQLIENSAELFDKEERKRARSQMLNSQDSLITSLYLATSYRGKTLYFSANLDNIQKQLDGYSKVIFSSFTSCFPHHHLSDLRGLDLIDALYALFFKTKVAPKNKQESIEDLKNNKLMISMIVRSIYLMVFSVLNLFIIQSLGVPFSYNILITLIGNFLIIYIFWKDLLSPLADKFIFRGFYRLNLFTDFKFFMRTGIPDTLFVWNQKLNLLLGTKMLAVKQIRSSGYNEPDQFFRGIAPLKLSFSYTTIQSPFSCLDLKHGFVKHLNEPNQRYLIKYAGNKGRLIDWLSMRASIWSFMFFISANSYKFTSIINNKVIDSLEEELQDKFDEIDLVFRTYFSNYPRVVLKDRKLLSGLKVILLKNKFFRREGTYLPYTLIQGVVLSNINKIMDELKKSIKTQVAAEFNTPLNLTNQIIVGNTINTEFCREEIPFGFKLDQVRNLLISGGTNSQRDNVAMKFISELVKNNVPSIIFDFKGNYSKLINSFSKTQFKNDFHYFKLGQSFQISLLKSDIKNDIDNTKYLDYVYECLGMVFKFDDKALLDLKKEVKLLDLEVKSLDLNEELKKVWEKNRKLEQSMSKLTEFLDLTRSTISALGLPEGAITSEDFLKDGKTVIIDLTLLRPPYNLFGMFVIISKIIRYIEEFEKFQPKMLIMPNIEYFFDKYYLDRWIKSPIIDLFLEPLAEKGFGFLFLVNEINKLHPTVYNYLENFIALKTVNSYDFQVLKNLFNLQEIQGQGYYTNKRKNTYQIDFLKQLKEDMAIIKREDYDQPFPVKFRLDKIKNVSPVQYEELISYMRQFGYDFQKTEKQIEQSLKKTLFQKDFEGYYNLIDEIKNFLQTIKVTDTIAGLNEHKLKGSLFKFIQNKLTSKNFKKKEITDTRNKLFNLLLSHQYIIESHPRTAGNTESLQTSYRVGPQYNKALVDEMKFIHPFNIGVDVEPIELNNNDFESVMPKNEDNTNYWNPSKNDQEEINKHEIEIDNEHLNSRKKIPWEKLVGGFLISETARVGTKINNKNYREAILSVKTVIPEFMYKLYDQNFEIRRNKKIDVEDFEKSIKFIINSKIIPFDRQELEKILKKINIEKCNSNDLENIAKENYKILYNFSVKILMELTET